MVNKDARTLGIVDPAAGRQVAAVPFSGVTGHEVVASADGRLAYVPIYGDSGVGKPGSDGRTLDVIDLAARARVAQLDFGGPERPHCALFGRDGRLYVTTEVSSTLSVVDTRSLAVVERIPTGQPESHMLALTRDGARAYTSNVGAGTVSAIDLVAKRVTAVIRVSERAQRIALSVDDRFVFTADQAEPRLAVLATARDEVERYVPLPGIAYASTPTPDGRLLLLALRGDSRVAVLELESLSVLRSVEVPRAPQEILVRPDGRVAYVSCDQSGVVVALDLETWRVVQTIETGDGADGLAWAGP